MRFRSRQRWQPLLELGSSIGDDTAGVEARLQAQLDALLQAQLTTVEVVQATRVELERRQSELMQALALVAQACEKLGERMQADHDERIALVESLATSVTPEIRSHPMTETAADLPDTARVLGGTVFPTSVDIDLADTNITEYDDTAVDTVSSRGALVEVRFGARWFDGFEVCEVVERGGKPLCRVRRCSDGWVRPEWFDATEVRQIDRPLADLA